MSLWYDGGGDGGQDRVTMLVVIEVMEVTVV